MTRFVNWLKWLKQRPLAIINLFGILVIIFGIFGYVVFQTTRDINVLDNWHIALSNPKQTRDVDGKTVAVYNPGDSLVLTSQSTKVTNAEGVSVRTIICDATETQGAREIQLDTVPATRPVGQTPKRENAVSVPDVSQFAGLPRWCKLVIDVTYKNVNNTGRTWQEHAETEKFMVEEAKLDTRALLEKIESLEAQITALKTQLPVNEGEVSSVSPAATPQPAPASGGSTATMTPSTNNSQPAQPTPVDDRSALGRLPLVGGLFDAIGL